jgi:hypothetical protein
MPFYESLYCGILHIRLNEQYIYKIFCEEGITAHAGEIKDLANCVEDELNMWPWDTKSLNLKALILSAYKGKRHAKQARKDSRGH